MSYFSKYGFYILTNNDGVFMSYTKKKESEKSINNAESIALPDQIERIAELAYYRAESRGFEPGYELNDWLEAERELTCCESN